MISIESDDSFSPIKKANVIVIDEPNDGIPYPCSDTGGSTVI
jgi:hypothetical protein